MRCRRASRRIDCARGCGQVFQTTAPCRSGRFGATISRDARQCRPRPLTSSIASPGLGRLRRPSRLKSLLQGALDRPLWHGLDQRASVKTAFISPHCYLESAGASVAAAGALGAAALAHLAGFAVGMATGTGITAVTLATALDGMVVEFAVAVRAGTGLAGHRDFLQGLCAWPAVRFHALFRSSGISSSDHGLPSSGWVWASSASS